MSNTFDNVKPLFESERNAEQQQYDDLLKQRIASIPSLISNIVLTKKKPKRTLKGKKARNTRTTHVTRTTVSQMVPPAMLLRYRGNARSMLLNNLQQRMMGGTSYAQPVSSSDEIRLQKAKNDADAAQRTVNDYKVAMAQYQADKAKSDSELKAAKSNFKAMKQRADDEKRRADEAEKYKDETNKQMQILRDSAMRLQAANSKYNLKELEAENDNLTALNTMLEFEINEREAAIKENKVAHDNEQLDRVNKALKIKRDALDKTLKSDIYSKSLEQQALLTHTKALLEQEVALREKVAKQMNDNYDIELKIRSYPTVEEIGDLNRSYDEQIAAALQDSAKKKEQLGKIEDALYKNTVKHDIWKEAVKDNEHQTVELIKAQKQKNLLDKRLVGTSYNKLINDIETTRGKIDVINEYIDDVSDHRKRRKNLSNERDDLQIELLRKQARHKRNEMSKPGLINDITALANSIGTNEGLLEDANIDNEKATRLRKVYTELSNRLGGIKNDLLIEKGKTQMMNKCEQKFKEEIMKLRKGIAEKEVMKDHAAALNEMLREFQHADGDLNVEKSVGDVISSEDYLKQTLDIVDLERKVHEHQMKKEQQAGYNKAKSEFNKNVVIHDFLDKCGEEAFDLHTYAHNITDRDLEIAGITSGDDKATVYKAIKPIADKSLKDLLHRQHIAAVARKFFEHRGDVDVYTATIRERGIPDIRTSANLDNETFDAATHAFCEINECPGLFDNVQANE